jgi:hypothetical protein
MTMSVLRRISTGLAWITLAACGHSQPTPVTPESGALAGELVDAEGKPAPTWVTAPSSYRKDEDDNKVICGEGSMAGTQNMSMAQSASAGRARTSLARELDLKVKSMLKDYQATTTGGANFGSAANDEQHVVDAAKQVTDTTLSGTEISQTWVSSQSTLHTLVCLNVDRFKGIVGGMAQLDESIRAAVVQRADAAWAELDDVTAH